VNEQDFCGVAHRRTAGFGVFNDGKCLCKIGAFIGKQMANAGARFDDGNLCVFDTGADEPLAASWDEQIYLAYRRHQCRGGGSVGVGDKLKAVCGKSAFFNSFPKGFGNGDIGMNGFLSAPQYADITAFECQSRRIGGDIGTAFVDHGKHPERYGYFLNLKTVWTRFGCKYSTYGVGKGSHFQNGICHGVNAPFGQTQAVKHHGGDVALGIF
jgi:hypothetical protein